MWLHEERKIGKKRQNFPVSMGATARTQEVMRGEDREERQQQYRERVYSVRVWVLGGSVCRVAWPIVCKGSRSSSKEPAEEEEEEGSEAN